MEDGHVHYVPFAAPSRTVAGHSRQHSSPGEGKKKLYRSSVKLPRQFEISSPSVTTRQRAVVVDPTFASALASQPPRGKARRGERDRRAAPVFRVG